MPDTGQACTITTKSAGALEFICADEVSADGTVSLAFTHASDYVIVIDKDGKDGDKKKGSGGAESALPETPGGNSTVKAVKSPQTGEPRRPWWTVVTGILAIIVSADVYFTARKKKEQEKMDKEPAAGKNPCGTETAISLCHPSAFSTKILESKSQLCFYPELHPRSGCPWSRSLHSSVRLHNTCRSAPGRSSVMR